MRVDLKIQNNTFVCFNIKRMKSEKTEIQLHIINKIKVLRQKNNISQAQISEILNLNSLGQVGNIESPKFKHKYTLKQIYQLLKEFDYPIEKFFLSDDELNKSVPEIID